MKSFCLLVSLFLAGFSLAHAQVTHYRNSLRIGADYMSLDAPDDLGYRYMARYGRHFGKDRLVLEGSLGYLSTPNRHLLAQQVYLTGLPRKRITADLTIAFDLLGSSHHALRLGGGPSLWYRSDDALRSASYIVHQDGSLTDISVVRSKINEVNLGYHLIGEYEYALDNNVTLGARVGIASFTKAGMSSLAGINIGYRF